MAFFGYIAIITIISNVLPVDKNVLFIETDSNIIPLTHKYKYIQKYSIYFLLSNLKRALMAAVAGEGAVMAVEAGMMAVAHSGPMASCQGPSIHEPKFLRGRLPK